MANRTLPAAAHTALQNLLYSQEAADLWQIEAHNIRWDLQNIDDQLHSLAEDAEEIRYYHDSIINFEVMLHMFLNDRQIIETFMETNPTEFFPDPTRSVHLDVNITFILDHNCYHIVAEPALSVTNPSKPSPTNTASTTLPGYTTDTPAP
ncbi:hypothetical protein QCA50_014645 [Cerrena zonata]|uniref:Uncharacterized protein n=1 Tax=Cerrena zonata TaxID=2478898 RepID=A0AAW0FM44_9APHY